MGTRSNIIAKTSDGQWKRIYTHWDGYPDHHGPILLDNYQDQEKIDALMALGDLSIFNPELGKKHSFDGYKLKPGSKAYKRHHDEWCLAYGRDRGETDIDASVYETAAAAIEDTTGCGAEFVYVWDGQLWSLTTPEAGIAGLVSLREFMKGKTTIEQTVKAFGGDFVMGKRTISASNP